jgi:acyl-CoA synthetase (AMP-forming)/AMP-acid ligase II
MPPELARQFQTFGATASLPVVGPIGEAMFVEGYGMVELGGGVAAKVSPPLVRLPIGDLLGVPMPPNRFRVVDGEGKPVRSGAVGELQIKGPGVLKGYHGDEAATRAVLTGDGWLRTGDLARRGPLGTVLFAGRSKDVIKVGGYSVYALEVQQALEEHSDVAEAAVLGVPDERVGERVVAAVRLKPGRAVTADQLRHFAEERLSAYKVPSQIRIVDELPRTGTDKVKKSDLVGLFNEQP